MVREKLAALGSSAASRLRQEVGASVSNGWLELRASSLIAALRQAALQHTEELVPAGEAGISQAPLTVVRRTYWLTTAGKP